MRTAIIKALSLFMAKSDVRYYMNGIYLDPEGYAVATNGHQMLVVSVPNTLDCLIPADSVKTALYRNYSEEIAITEDTMRGIPYTPVDGKYVDWRAITKKTKAPIDKSPSICFEWRYVAEAEKALRLLADSKTATSVLELQPDNGPGILRCAQGPEAIAYIMGKRP